MWAFIVAIIVFGLALVLISLVPFAYGTSENQSSEPSNAARTTLTAGTLLSIAIVGTHWLPHLGW
jgi:hypothetical protein